MPQMKKLPKPFYTQGQEWDEDLGCLEHNLLYSLIQITHSLSLLNVTSTFLLKHLAAIVVAAV